MNVTLLNKIRAAGGEFVPIEDLTSFGDVDREIEAIEAFGFTFERHPYRGIAYRGPAWRLCPDQIEHELGTRIIGRRIAVWNRVGSTNDLAASASHSKANDGLVVLAEEQTAGRGQRGRTWSAPPSTSILFSTLIFPRHDLADPAWLIALAALSVVDLVSEVTGRSAKIKWPNDVRVDRKKVAGILVERGQGAVVGIGLNVNLIETDFPEPLKMTATSLQILKASEQPLDRSELVRMLMRNLDRRYRESLEQGPNALEFAWKNAFEHLGRMVRLSTVAGVYLGRLDDLGFDRGMVLDCGNGPRTRVELNRVLGLEEIEEI